MVQGSGGWIGCPEASKLPHFWVGQVHGRARKLPTPLISFQNALAAAQNDQNNILQRFHLTTSQSVA